MTRASERVALARAVQAESHWQELRGTQRIVTLTRFVQETDFKQAAQVDEHIEDEFLTLTLGGRVGDLGQKVPGEAAVPVGAEALLFVGPEAHGHRRILGMAQGAYRTQDTDAGRVLSVSRSLPRLVGRRRGADAPPLERLAVDVLGGRLLSDAHQLIRGAR